MTTLTSPRTLSPAAICAADDRLDSVANLDLGNRGVEHLHAAARHLTGASLVGHAASMLAVVPDRATVVLTTGSVSRAWISPRIGENDGPAGIAVVARAMAIAKHATGVLYAEETLLPQISGILTAAGLTVLPVDEAIEANSGGTLAAVAVRPFTTRSEEAAEQAEQVLNELQPALLFSAERVGRNSAGVYHSMRGLDFGQGRARVDELFDRAMARKIPTVAVGDGGNEIGMGNVADAVRAHVRFGDACQCGCGAGLGAVSTTSALVTAACSNWGCYAIVASLALRMQDESLLHTAVQERFLLERGVALGLINSMTGLVDANVDNIPVATHLAAVELLSSIVSSCLATG